MEHKRWDSGDLGDIVVSATDSFGDLGPGHFYSLCFPSVFVIKLQDLWSRDCLTWEPVFHYQETPNEASGDCFSRDDNPARPELG